MSYCHRDHVSLHEMDMLAQSINQDSVDNDGYPMTANRDDNDTPRRYKLPGSNCNHDRIRKAIVEIVRPQRSNSVYNRMSKNSTALTGRARSCVRVKRDVSLGSDHCCCLREPLHAEFLRIPGPCPQLGMIPASKYARLRNGNPLWTHLSNRN